MLIQFYLPKSIVYSDCLRFYLMPLSVPESDGHRILFSVSPPVAPPGCDGSSEFPRFFMTLTVLRSIGQLICGVPLDCMFFSWLELGLWVWGGQPQRERAIFITSYQGYVQSAGLITVDKSLTEVVFVSFLHAEVTFFFFLIASTICFLEGRHYAQPTLKKWEVCPPHPWRQSIYTNYLENFCMGDFSLRPIDLFSHFYVSMN